MLPRRTFPIALAVTVLALLAAELGCRLLPPSGLHSYLLPRNPAVRYGWSTWTEPRPRSASTRLVIVLSNSQGYAPELTDPQATWPAQLERGLVRAGGDWRVASWSLTAARGPELVALAAQAARHEPDLVLVVAGAGSFSWSQARWRVGFQANDLVDLVAQPQVRDRLPLSYLERMDPIWALRWTDQLRARSALVRLRDRVPLLERGVAAAAQEPPDDPALSTPPADAQALGDRLLEELRAAVRTSDAALLFVGQPLGGGASQADRAARAGFIARTAARWADDPRASVIDAIDVVDPEDFITVTHMRGRGHARFAGWLEPRVLAALGD